MHCMHVSFTWNVLICLPYFRVWFLYRKEVLKFWENAELRKSIDSAKNPNILPFHLLFKLSVAKFMFKIKHKKAPIKIRSCFIITSDIHDHYNRHSQDFVPDRLAPNNKIFQIGPSEISHSETTPLTNCSFSYRNVNTFYYPTYKLLI